MKYAESRELEHIKAFVLQCIADKQDASLLLQHLLKIQAQYLYIPPTAISVLQQTLSLTYSEISAVIEFYSFLSATPLGAYHILISDNITDRYLGNQRLYQQLTQALDDAAVSIELTSCTGLCDQGPGMLVNGQAINRVDHTRLQEIVALIKQHTPVAQWPAHLFAIEDNIRRKDIQLDAVTKPGAAIAYALQQGAEHCLHILQESGLRGRGGAGFSTASKWRLCAQTESSMRYVVCNADEGEPGTFKDRVLLTRYAHEVIEGMTACAAVIGASQGLVYLRGEYAYLEAHLQQVLQQRREQGLLGKAILGKAGFDFDIDIHLGAGAYICGEESALIESLEGKRGIPRIRPPFPVVSGYKNKPTVVNNVESLWSVCHILQHGSDWFTQVGTQASRGTRLLSISGDCQQPGIYEFPFGVTLTQILAECGGEDAMAVQMAGAAGTTVLAKDFQRRMCYDDLSTGGSFMVMGAQRSLLDMLVNFAGFFKHESCGFCTPCRVGSSLLNDLLQGFKQGKATQADTRQLKTIAELMRQSSFCGLGTSAPTALLNALQQSPEIFDQVIDAREEGRQFDLQAAVMEYQHIVQSNAEEGS